MKTGFGESSGAFEDRQMEALTDILIPVLEKSMLMACKYSQACERDVVLPQDVEYAAKYCVMHTVGQDVGISVLDHEDEDEDEDEWETDEDEDEDDVEVVEPEDCPAFKRYEGDDPVALAMNEAHDKWSTWEPTNPVEIMLKNAIDRGDATGALGGVEF
jgi:hypothetical protein